MSEGAMIVAGRNFDRLHAKDPTRSDVGSEGDLGPLRESQREGSSVEVRAAEFRAGCLGS
jgi:hypothetical protein